MGRMKQIAQATNEAGMTEEAIEMQWAVLIDGAVQDVWYSEAAAIDQAHHIAGAWNAEEFECVEVIPMVTFAPIIVLGEHSVGIQ